MPWPCWRRDWRWRVNSASRAYFAVCNEDNDVSEKVIDKNGGIFENRLYDPDE